MSDKKMGGHNLDRLAARHAQAIIEQTVDDQGIKASEMDNTITKTLGVLMEDGVYACFLYLLAKEKENGRAVVQEMLRLVDELGFDWGKPVDDEPRNVLAHISERVTQKLEPMLLVKEILERMLIYARYGAKARA